MTFQIRLLLWVLFYATPITYPLSLVPTDYRELMWLNPLTCMVEPLRDVIAFGQKQPVMDFGAFISVSIVLLTVSVWIF